MPIHGPAPGGATGTGGGGGALKTRTPEDVFAGANRGAAEAARNAGLDAAAIAEFDADPNLAIILRVGGADTYQVRRAAAWRDVTNVVRGPGPTAAQVEAALGLSAQDLANLFVDAAVEGAGRDRTIVVRQADGSDLRLAVPEGDGGEPGGGGGIPLAVGISPSEVDKTSIPSKFELKLYVARGAYSGTTQAEVTIGGVAQTIPAAIGESTTETSIQVLVTSAMRRALEARADGAVETVIIRLLDAGNVEQANTTVELVVVPDERAQVVSTAAARRLEAADEGKTVRLTGATARTWQAPLAVRIGWWARLLNTATANLTFDVGITSRIVGAGQTHVVKPDEAIAVQYLGAATWAVVTDTEAGAAAAIPDDSIAPQKAQAGTDAQKKAWRARVASAHIGSGSALPAAAVSNVGDVWIFPQAVAAGLEWRDVSDQATTIRSANAGDVGLYLAGRSGWVRVGNILGNRDGSAVGRERVVLAATRTRDTDGVTSLQLPADANTFGYVDLVAFVSGVPAGDGTRESAPITIPMAWLFAAEDADAVRIGFPSEENGDSQWLTWTPSTRTFGRGAETAAALRIAYCRLHDGGVAPPQAATDATARQDAADAQATADDAAAQAQLAETAANTARNEAQTAQREADTNAAALAALPPFARIAVLPSSVNHSHWPPELVIVLEGPRAAASRIAKVRAAISGLQIGTKAVNSADFSGVASTANVLVYEVSAANRNNLANARSDAPGVDVSIDFLTADDAVVATYRVNIPHRVDIGSRRETTLAASPVVLPRGTHTLRLSAVKSNRLYTREVLVSDLTAANLGVGIESGNANSNDATRDLFATLAFVGVTRTLTYSFGGDSRSGEKIVAIGES